MHSDQDHTAQDCAAAQDRAAQDRAEQDYAARQNYAAQLGEAAAAHRAAAGRLQSETSFPQRWEPLRRAHLRRAEDFLARAEAPRPESEHSVAALAAARPQQLVEEALATARSLPRPEAGVSRPKLDLRIGIVCDRFLYDTFTGLAGLTPITPANWEEHLGSVDLLLVAATWRGHDGAAWDVTAPEAPRNRRLLTGRIIPTYREQGVPTVFYGKEDPPDYQEFLDVARVCEHILTTAEEMLPRYAADCPGARSIAVLPFAVNPLLHTPLGSRRARPGQGGPQDREDAPSPLAAQDLIFFAGSWMGRKYPQRAEYARWILDGILQAGRPFAFVDRWWGARNPVTGLPTPNQLVPFEYWPHRVPSMGHEELMQLQRVTDVAVNFNSVTDSMTMFANRVLELQASGTMVLSTRSRGVSARYPQVHVASSAEEVARRLENLGTEELRGIQSAGIRQVFLEHHGADLLASAARRAGLQVQLPTERVVAVAGEVTAELADEMSAQRLPGGACVTLTTWEELNEQEADILLPVSPEHSYPPHYAADHLAAFRYQSAETTAKIEGPPARLDGLVHRHAPGSEAAPGFDLALTAWWRPAANFGEALTEDSLRKRAAAQRLYLLPHPEHWEAPETPGERAETEHASAEAAGPSPTRRLRDRLGDRLGGALRGFKRTIPGRAAAAVYRRTLKPAETGLRQELEAVTADVAMIGRIHEEAGIAGAESRAEAARRRLCRGSEPSQPPDSSQSSARRYSS